MLGRRQVFLKPRKELGQSFLTNRSVAVTEAEHALGKRVLELGPGYGILTRELCRYAERVVAVELDRNLFRMLKHELDYPNLKLINGDFFEIGEDELELKTTDIMISNVPYSLSSRVIDFLVAHRLQAVLCLQKEFVEHMLAAPGSRKYSRLSVMSQLHFSITKMMDVERGNFSPSPKVDSAILYLKPRERRIGDGERELVNLLMQHKKKTVRNAVMDSESRLGVGRKELGAIADGLKEGKSRVFQMAPEELLALARELEVSLGRRAPAPGRV
jgi:16S rRNA (adenine1518-N6/adenine1519-N6)-dimethyltransferase